MKELLQREDLDLNSIIFATDIDREALNKAQEGVYSFEAVKNIKYGLLKKFFIIKGSSFKLVPEIKKSVSFSFYDLP